MSRTVESASRTLLAMLVLAVWLAAPLLPMPRANAAAVAAVLAAQTICHAGDPHDGGADRRSPAHPADRDCGVCPVCNAIAAPVLAPSAPAALPPPTVLAETGHAAAPAATGPPPAARIAARPRAPPARSV